MNNAQSHAVPAWQRWLALFGWMTLSFGAAFIGVLFAPDEWYEALNKPTWTPPNWVFGPVWTTLYAMMAVAAWLVWQHGGFARQRRALTWFVTQLAWNAAWTPLFFGWQRPGIAFVEIVLLWGAIVMTVLAFHQVSRVAAWLLAPYLAWVSFAAVLNFFPLEAEFLREASCHGKRWRRLSRLPLGDSRVEAEARELAVAGRLTDFRQGR